MGVLKMIKISLKMLIPLKNDHLWDSGVFYARFYDLLPLLDQTLNSDRDEDDHGPVHLNIIRHGLPVP
jgi:hypothetical protein